MAAQKKAKIASSKGSAKKFFYEGKVIKPCRLISKNRNFICAEYENGDHVKNSNNEIIPWRNVIDDAKTTIN